MNERIAMVFFKAGGSIEAVEGDNSYLTYCDEGFDPEMFAEVLIRECCGAIESTDRHRSDYFIAKVREHFGVEESGIDPQLRNRSTYFGNNP